MMNQEKHAETQVTLKKILPLLSVVLEQARTIRDWNWYDLLGGNMMISWDKRKQIRHLTQHLAQLQPLMGQLSQQSSQLTDTLVKSEYQRIWQPWIGQQMTDFKVNQEIADLVHHLENLEQALHIQLTE